MVEKHMHLHPLIPNSDGSFLMGQEIWKQSTYEMYKFCINNDLRCVWAYIWCNWYRKETWILWARSEIPKKFAYFRQQCFVNHIGRLSNGITYQSFSVLA